MNDMEPSAGMTMLSILKKKHILRGVVKRKMGAKQLKKLTHKHHLHDVECEETGRTKRFCCLCVHMICAAQAEKISTIKLLPGTWKRGLDLLVSAGAVIWTKSRHVYRVPASAEAILEAHRVKFKVLARMN